MSAAAVIPPSPPGPPGAEKWEEKKKKKKKNSGGAKNYKGFVAGVFSGIAKLSGMHLLCSSLDICLRRQWDIRELPQAPLPQPS